MNPDLLLALIGVSFALYYSAVWLRYLPPPGVPTLLKIRGTNIDVVRGVLRSHSRDHLKGILSESNVSKGFITMSRANRVTFSRHIPDSVHQRLRNVLLNQ